MAIRKRRVKRVKPETVLASRISAFIRMHFPDIIFRFDLAADMPLPMHLAKRGKELHGERNNRGYPDLFLAWCTKKYGGLYLELKAGDKVPNTEHTRRQSAYHHRLKLAGYKVSFCCGYEECTRKIKKYLRKL